MIVITAPTSKIGRQVLERILVSGEDIRVIARDPQRIPESIRQRVEVIQGSHADRDVVNRAFEGADAVFWLVPADKQAESVYDAYVRFSIPAADAIVRHRVGRVVAISALGRGQHRYAGNISASLAMEDLFRSTAVNFRALTMPSFMDNMLRQLPFIKNEGLIRFTLPGNQKSPTVATSDIAAAASRLLLDREWSGQENLAVLGPEDLSYEDMAEILTEVLGTPVRFEQMTLDSYKQLFLHIGYSEAMAQSMVDMDIAGAAGINNGLQRTPENTSPTSFRQWATAVLKPAFDAM
ncbi:NAD(P)H-binding protein [Paenibacillus physcomitrellae]|uniref:Nucleotide-diphosphate-sugar epimerase n=1 Tax=Paenibacillus physcomitrellae TaxID=1619311 RepID=A0ABQ1GLK0_9BACL|nr:NAD(P)H-binding protein [Paenibacillus physcomitrellae]GGA45993.1 nucleotide-diphosphate-sugar epimerase [Paenibacillus physcomitrellae]